MPKVSVIVPVYNHVGLTEQCLRTISDETCEIVVVDDGSTDATPRLLDAQAARIKRVRHETNQGFGASCNEGGAVASGEYLLFLNNDTIPQPGWLDALVTYAQNNPNASVVGSKLIYPDNTIQHAGVVICQDRYPRHIYRGFPVEHPAVSKSRQFQIVTAACLLVRRCAFEKAGGFDLGFRNGFEDVDLCLRLRAAGHEIHYCAESVVQHLESVSPDRFKSDRENVNLYRERWLNRVRPDDVDYYLEDGLLQFAYEGTFPITISLSPRLAIRDDISRQTESERVIDELSQRNADLRRENTRLALQMAAATPDSAARQYEMLRRRIRATIQSHTPCGAKILVVSKGDRALLEVDGRQAGHFPQTTKGSYAGHHPADSFNAIAQLEGLRTRGAEYLVFPKTAFWWLEHYREFERHLRSNYREVINETEACLIFELRQTAEPSRPSAEETPTLLENPERAPRWEPASSRSLAPALTKEIP